MKCILFYLVAVTTLCAAVDLGYVDNFQVSEFGVGYVRLTWDLVEGDATHMLHKYSLTIDDDLTSEFKCTAATCAKLIEDLDACVEHLFELTPIFYAPSGDDVQGDLATTTGYTTDELPGEVSNIHVLTDTDVETTMKWNPPSVNSKCTDSYEVCFRLDGLMDNICVESNSTQVTMMNLTACGLYHVTVTPVTPSGMRGPLTEYEFKTHDGVPGEPQDVEVGLITPETIQLLWNNPIINYLCLDKFFITIGETHAKVVRPMKRETIEGFDNAFTFNPLDPCTNYTIDIASANVAELTSDKIIKYASTDETEPLAPPTITVTPTGPDTIEVSWGDNENDRCAGSFEVCWYDGVHPVEQCQEVGGDGDNNLVITDLVACSNYEVIVTVQSPNGSFVSNATSNSTSTPDVRPGPVVNLRTTDIDAHQLSVSCKPPTTDPQCVKEVIYRVKDTSRRSQWRQIKSSYEGTFTGLEACTDYIVQVSTVSPNGLESAVEETRNTTLDDVPSAPQMLGTKEITTNSIKLQWFQPTTNPQCASEYNLTWEDGVYTDGVKVSGASTFKVEYVVTGLRSCTTYNFKLFAESSAGAGPEVTHTETTVC